MFEYENMVHVLIKSGNFIDSNLLEIIELKKRCYDLVGFQKETGSVIRFVVYFNLDPVQALVQNF